MTAPVSEDVNQTLKESTMNQQEKAERFTELMTRFTSVLGKILPDDVATRLAELRKEQTSDISRIVYDAMFDDLAAARRLNVPLCQDTGVIQYYIEVGANFPLLSEMRACLDEAVRRATIEAPLRQNAVQIFDERNTGNNTGVRVPWIDWEIIPDSDSCLIHGYMAGGGCSLPNASRRSRSATGPNSASPSPCGSCASRSSVRSSSRSTPMVAISSRRTRPSSTGSRSRSSRRSAAR